MDKIVLAKKLKDLVVPDRLSVGKEQYVTDVSTAVDFLAFVDYVGKIKDRRIADVGCGNGILGIGAALSGAAMVDMYDYDTKMVECCAKNIVISGARNCRSVLKDLFDIGDKYEVVIANPPFGFQSSFNIKAFILKLDGMADSFFFIYKDNMETHKMAVDNDLKLQGLGNMRLKKSAFFHKKEHVELPICVLYRA